MLSTTLQFLHGVLKIPIWRVTLIAWEQNTTSRYADWHLCELSPHSAWKNFEITIRKLSDLLGKQLQWLNNWGKVTISVYVEFLVSRLLVYFEVESHKIYNNQCILYIACYKLNRHGNKSDSCKTWL